MTGRLRLGVDEEIWSASVMVDVMGCVGVNIGPLEFEGSRLDTGYEVRE